MHPLYVVNVPGCHKEVRIEVGLILWGYVLDSYTGFFCRHHPPFIGSRFKAWLEISLGSFGCPKPCQA